MRVMRGRRLLALSVVLAALAGTALIARPYIHGLSFVIRAAEMQGAPRRVADLDTTRVSEREITIPTRRGPLRARLYEPSRSHAPRRAADLGTPSGRHRRAAARRARAPPLRERPHDRHARHPGAVALRDRAGDSRRDRSRPRSGCRRSRGSRRITTSG